LKPAEAYKLTLREIVLYAEGRRIAEGAEYRKGIDHAYLGARLSKTDPAKFPDHPAKFYPRKTVKLTPKQRAEQNAARMRAFAKARNAHVKKQNAAPPEVKRRPKKEKQ
jgi:hypothetical protein